MAEQKEEKKVVPEQDSEFARAADAVLRTEQGRKLWAWMANRLGFYKSNVRRTSSGEIAPISVEILEGQRSVYIEMRALATYDLLIAAEALADPANKSPQKPKEERKK